MKKIPMEDSQSPMGWLNFTAPREPSAQAIDELPARVAADAMSIVYERRRFAKTSAKKTVPLVLVADRAEMPLGRLTAAGVPSPSTIAVAFPTIVDTIRFTKSTARIRLLFQSVKKSVPSDPSEI